MATLTNRNINETYFGLLKTNDNESINGLTRVTDGLGCNSSISINCGDGSSNALCVHGNLTFDTLCNFNFPQAGSSTNEIFIVNCGNVTLGNANDTLQNQFTFTGGTSTFCSPKSFTINDKGIITDIDPAIRTIERTYLYYGPSADTSDTSGMGCGAYNAPSFQTIESFLNDVNGLDLNSAVGGEGHLPGDIATVIFSKSNFNQAILYQRFVSFYIVYRAQAVACTSNPSGICYLTCSTNFDYQASYPKASCAYTNNTTFGNNTSNIPLTLNVSFT